MGNHGIAKWVLVGGDDRLRLGCLVAAGIGREWGRVLAGIRREIGIKVPEKEVRQEKEVKVESSKRERESLEQEIAKKQKMEQESEELKNVCRLFQMMMMMSKLVDGNGTYEAEISVGNPEISQYKEKNEKLRLPESDMFASGSSTPYWIRTSIYPSLSYFEATLLAA
nr:hypothetical protein [Tanacetum cinerariifolium]